jgi:hypothetical protein
MFTTDLSILNPCPHLHFCFSLSTTTMSSFEEDPLYQAMVSNPPYTGAVAGHTAASVERFGKREFT